VPVLGPAVMAIPLAALGLGGAGCC
jgi:hypothetical protein